MYIKIYLKSNTYAVVFMFQFQAVTTYRLFDIFYVILLFFLFFRD